MRYGNIQSQGGLNQRVFDVGLVAPLLQASAEARFFAELRVKLFRRDPILHQHRFGVADAHFAIFTGGDFQIVAPFPLAVGIHIKGVDAFANRAGRETRQVDLFATADDKTIVKLIDRSRVFLSAGKWRKAAQRNRDSRA